MVYKILNPVFLIGVIWMGGCALLRHWPDTIPMYEETRQGDAYAHHLAGIIHEHNAELDQAAAAYTEVIGYDEKAVTPRLRLIRTYLRLGKNQEAVTACEMALKQIPDSPELWIAMGELYHDQGNMDKAVEALKRAIALRPDNLAGYGALVELQEENNDLVAVIEIYERLIERSPDSAALYYQLGTNLSRIGDHAGARNAFERVLTLEPNVTRVRFLLALVLFEQQEYQKCEEQLRVYLKERPEDVLAMQYQAGVLYRLGRVEEAREILEVLITQGSASPKDYLQLSWLMLQAGETERAQQFALEGGACFLADVIFALSLFEKPEEDAWPTNPWDDRYTLDEIEAETDLILASLSGLMGSLPMGDVLIGKLEVLRENMGFSPILEFFCARVFLYSEKYGEALVLLDTLRARGTNSKHIHYHSATVAEKKKSFSDAEYHLRAFLEIEPDNADVLNFLGYLYADYNQKLDEAEDLLRRALAIDPENPYYLDSLGWVYYRQGKGEEAAQLVRQAIYGMEGDDALLRDHLGDIYFLLGNTERALAEWRHAIRLDPSLEKVRDKIETHTSETNP